MINVSGGFGNESRVLVKKGGWWVGVGGGVLYKVWGRGGGYWGWGN